MRARVIRIDTVMYPVDRRGRPANEQDQRIVLELGHELAELLHLLVGWLVGWLVGFRAHALATEGRGEIKMESHGGHTLVHTWSAEPAPLAPPAWFPYRLRITYMR